MRHDFVAQGNMNVYTVPTCFTSSTAINKNASYASVTEAGGSEAVSYDNSFAFITRRKRPEYCTFKTARAFHKDRLLQVMQSVVVGPGFLPPPLPTLHRPGGVQFQFVTFRALRSSFAAFVLPFSLRQTGELFSGECHMLTR